MTTTPVPVSSSPPAVLPGDLRTTWLIAWRGAIESLRDRLTLSMSALFALVLPLVIVLLVVRPQAVHTGGLGILLATYLLVVGLMPTSGASSVAAGLFAGEKEQGNLAPLLATPASNRAIFGGKVLAAVLPALIYAVIAEASYLAEVAVLIGAGRLRLLPVALSLAMLALVPAYAVLGAAVASLISSRVRTYQSAQMLASLVLFPIMAVLFGFAFLMQHWGAWWLLVAVAGMLALDTLLIVLGAATWRREEVLARR